jgi:hypothetical protein
MGIPGDRVGALNYLCDISGITPVILALKARGG